jgi:putative phage-type endonuclease
MTVVPFKRTFTLGGSDAASAAGIDPYRSRVMLWAEKTGRVERTETEAMRWGIALEPVIVEALDAQGFVTDYPYPFADARDGERPWLVGHPDGGVLLDNARALLEVKTAGQWAYKGDEPPVAYVAQCQVYMHLTGLDRALLATLVGGQKLHTAIVERNDAAIGQLLDLMEELHGFLERDEPPAPAGDESSRAALLALYPAAQEGSRVRLSHREMGLYRQLRARREQEAAVKAQRVELENLLKARMGDAETAISPSDDVLVHWTNTSRSALDTARLKAERPDVYAEFLTTSATRRFTVV